MAILTKGPAAILIFLISFGVYLVFRRFKIRASFRDVMVFFLVVFFIGGSWYLLQIIKGNYQLIREFILYQIRLLTTEDAGHGGFFLYHFFVLLVGVFPASFMALLSFKDHFDGPGLRKEFFLFMMILFWVVLILFSIVNTKIVHYSSLCYFPITYFTALTFRKYENSEIRIPLLLKYFTGIAGVFFGLLVAILPFIDLYIDKIIEIIGRNDPFAAANLQADVSWPWFISLVGIGFIIAVITSLRLINRNRNWGMRILFISCSVFIYLTITLVTPRIEGYTQRAAVEFFKSVSSEKAYITTLGYKSYAHLYYGKVDPECGLTAADSHFLLEGDIDLDAYFVFKINRKENYLKEYPLLEILYEKNGFVFARRRK